jgi:hypothetical protein
MFFKRPHTQLSDWGSLREIAWDTKTVEWIVQIDRLNVHITHMLKTVSLGQMRANDEYRNSSEWSVHGVITSPKFIPVDITFTDDEEQFGGFFYDRRDDQDFDGRTINLPCLGVWLSDGAGQKAELLYAGLRDALTRGSKHLGVRFWKNTGEGLMTQIDKEHGYSYQSRYTILGMVTWPELHAQRLPRWAIPTDYKDFSLHGLPKNPSDLRGLLD